MEQLIKEYLNNNAPKYSEFKGYDESFVNSVKEFTEGAEPTEQVQLFYNEAMNAVKKFQEGGLIKKFQDGNTTYNLNIPEWFLKYRKQPFLTDWTKEKDASRAGENLTSNQFHHKYGDLTGAWNTNQAYTANKDIITSDLNNAYKVRYANLSLQDFVNNYNITAGDIRGRWLNRNDINYNDTDAQEHNLKHKDLFASRNNNTKEAWDLGYSPSTEKIQGSTTWMRNMDLYEKEFNDLTDEEKKNRIHKIGDLGYVYKKANGDIDIVDNDTLTKLGLNTPETPAVQTKTDLQSGFPTIGVTKNPLRGLKNPSEWLPDVFETAKFFDSLNTNKRMKNFFLNNYRYATEEYRPLHRNIYGDLAALNQGYNEATGIQSRANRLGNNTADYRTASAVNLQGNAQGEQVRANYRKTYNDLVRDTSEKALQLEFENIGKEQAVANENFARGIAASNVKMNNILEYMNQQHANRKNYMDYWETKIAQTNQDRKQFMAQMLQSLMERALDADPEILKYKKAYQEATTQVDLDKAWNAYVEAKQRRQKEILPIYYQQLASLKGFKWYPKSNPFIQYLKKGGTISDDGPVKTRSKDLERHRKARRDAMHYNDKKLDRLGRLTYLWAKRAQGKK